MTSRTSPAQSSFARRPFAERFCIDCLACWHWAALARTAHSSPAIPAQTPLHQPRVLLLSFHFHRGALRRSIGASSTTCKSATGTSCNTCGQMRRPPLLHAVHHTGQLLLHRGSGGAGGQVGGQRRGESQGGSLLADATPHRSRMPWVATPLQSDGGERSRRGPLIRGGGAPSP